MVSGFLFLCTICRGGVAGQPLRRLRVTSTIAEVAAYRYGVQDFAISPINLLRPFGLGGCGEVNCNGLLPVCNSFAFSKRKKGETITFSQIFSFRCCNQAVCFIRLLGGESLTSILKSSLSWRTEKILVRLSIVGLPLRDNIR